MKATVYFSEAMTNKCVVSFVFAPLSNASALRANIGLECALLQLFLMPPVLLLHDLVLLMLIPSHPSLIPPLNSGRLCGDARLPDEFILFVLLLLCPCFL